MQTSHAYDYQSIINEAIKKFKCKKALYIYDESGNKHLLGVFSKKKADEIKKYMEQKNLLDRLSEFDIRTTEPDSPFEYS